MPCNSGQNREQITPCLHGICKPLQCPATTDRTLVTRLGQRFESARRLSIHACKCLENRDPLTRTSGAVSAVGQQQTLSKASFIAAAVTHPSQRSVRYPAQATSEDGPWVAIW